jgi:DNA phosphorothioation-dependent restriction protein DptH
VWEHIGNHVRNIRLGIDRADAMGHKGALEAGKRCASSAARDKPEQALDGSLEQLSEPEFGRFVEILRDNPKPDRGLRTLLARLEELGDYGFFAPGEARDSLWDSEVPVLVRIHTTQNDNLQNAFASLVFYSLYKDMFRRGIKDRITHAVIFDEAHRAAGLKLIPTMAKECRKYGISLVLASQEAKDFHVSLFSAIANYLVLRLTETDAKALVRNVANSQQERVLIDKIKQMERFKALYFCEGKNRPSQVAYCPERPDGSS